MVRPRSLVRTILVGPSWQTGENTPVNIALSLDPPLATVLEEERSRSIGRVTRTDAGWAEDSISFCVSTLQTNLLPVRQL